MYTLLNFGPIRHIDQQLPSLVVHELSTQQRANGSNGYTLYQGRREVVLDSCGAMNPIPSPNDPKKIK